MVSGTIASTTDTVAHGIQNVSEIVNQYGYTKNSNQQCTPSGFNNNTGYYFAIFAGLTNVYIRTSSGYVGDSFYIVLEYTKTTD